MPYCSECSHIMLKQTTSDSIQFYCANCNTISTGQNEDTLMFSSIKTINENEMFGNFKRHASEDPSNFKKLIGCKKCTMPYMTLIRIGSQERGSLICRCGYEELYK